MEQTRATWAALVLFGLLGACGGGGDDDRTGFVPLDHNPLPEVPAGPELDDDAGVGTRPGTLPPKKVTLLELTTFEPAVAVIGQPDFFGQAPNQGAGPAADTLSLHYTDQRGVFEGEDLWVADAHNHRVLRYALPILGNGPSAEISLGQVDLASAHYGTTDRDLWWPSDVAVSGNKLFVCDTVNNRVLIYDPLPTTTGAQAQIVVGQPDMFSNGQYTTVKGFFQPRGFCVTENKLIVADTGNSRVLIWNYIPSGDHASASLVLGQPDFTSNTPATTARGMRGPSGVWSDGTKLLVADTVNDRVLVWNTFPTSNGQSPDLVLGQPDFTSGLDYSSSSVPGWPFAHPAVDVITGPMDIDSNGVQIVVATGHRVLIWNTWPDKDHDRPDVVLGQGSFTRGHPNDDNQDSRPDAKPTDRTFYWPASVHIAGKRLYVSDSHNNRVLIFE